MAKIAVHFERFTYDFVKKYGVQHTASLVSKPIKTGYVFFEDSLHVKALDGHVMVIKKFLVYKKPRFTTYGDTFNRKRSIRYLASTKAKARNFLTRRQHGIFKVDVL